MAGRTPRSRSQKDMAKKARRMVKRTGRPQEMTSLQVRLQVIHLDLLCVFSCNRLCISKIMSTFDKQSWSFLCFLLLSHDISHTVLL